MARKSFFSFKYEDVFRANVVRNSWVTQGKDAAGFVDAAEFRKIEAGGDPAIKKWIDDQLTGTSVTVVLVAANTNKSRWVKYEIEQSIKKGNGLLGVSISQINDINGKTTTSCGAMPSGYPFYYWYKDKGYENMGDWIEKAAKAAGR